VGAAGPIAGLVVAIPLLVIGLHLSEVGPPTPEGVIEGNSILYAALIAAARARAAVPSRAAGDLREAMRVALARARLDDGACSPAAIGPDGELHREPVVLEVSGEQLLLAP
ncbi:MAG TPA: hypothetical protein VK932_05395, partial [Kofleriaceae bacterium]|nr:hypothetical protein [Kofleriaceae bacterium]